MKSACLKQWFSSSPHWAARLSPSKQSLIPILTFGSLLRSHFQNSSSLGILFSRQKQETVEEMTSPIHLHLLLQDVFSHPIWGRKAKRGGLGRQKTFLRATQLCLSSTLRFQFLATPVPKYLLCTLEQTDDCSEDLKVSCCQGDHHFCLGQVHIAEVTRTTRKIDELCTSNKEPPPDTPATQRSHCRLCRGSSSRWAAGREIKLREKRGELELSQVLLSPSRGKLLPQDLVDSWRWNPAVSHHMGKKQTRALPTYPPPLSHFISKKSSVGSKPLFFAQLQHNQSLLGHSQLKHWVKEWTWLQQNPSWHKAAFWYTLTKGNHQAVMHRKLLQHPPSFYLVMRFFFFPSPRGLKQQRGSTKGEVGGLQQHEGDEKPGAPGLWCLDDHIIAITMLRALLCHW